MKRRYEGRVRTSNEALLALSERYPGTVYAKKARTYALGGDGLSGMLAASVLSGFWLFTGMQVMGEAVPMAPAPAMSACTALEQITCPGGPQPDPVACRIAKRRTEGDCQAALTGTGP